MIGFMVVRGDLLVRRMVDLMVVFASFVKLQMVAFIVVRASFGGPHRDWFYGRAR